MKDREFFKLGLILGNVLAAAVLKLKGENDSPVIKNFLKVSRLLKICRIKCLLSEHLSGPQIYSVMLNVIYFVKFNGVMKKRVLKKFLVFSLAKYGAHATHAFVGLVTFFFR